MQTVSTIGLDIAKSVFQVHGVDANGLVVVRRQLKRRYVLAFFEKLGPCLVGIEACASSHYWSRELQALGHNVRLMPPAYVKPYVKRQKNDMADAEAICEAVTRANMRFVPTKTPEQQSGLVLHRTRHLFIRQQTSLINAIRGHLAEFGVTAPVGRKGIEELLRVIADPSDKRVPDVVRACLAALGSQLLSLKKQILDFDRMIMAWHRSNQTSKRLNCIPGVGPWLATALVASVADPKVFRSGRNFSAWIGLVPKQHSSGGRARLGSISKKGDRDPRGLFVAGSATGEPPDKGTGLSTQPNTIFSVLIDGRRRLRSASCGGPNQRIAEISHTSGAIFFIGNYRITRGNGQHRCSINQRRLAISSRSWRRRYRSRSL